MMGMSDLDLLNLEMADILEVSSISDEDELNDNPAWDSLAVLSLFAFIDKNYNIQLNNTDIAAVQNLHDLKLLLSSKLKSG